MKKIVQIVLMLLPLSVFAQQITPRIRIDGLYFDEANFVTDNDVYISPGTALLRTTVAGFVDGIVTIAGTADPSSRDALLIMPNIYGNFKSTYEGAGYDMTGYTGTEHHIGNCGSTGGSFTGINLTDPSNQFITVEASAAAPFKFHEISLTKAPDCWATAFNYPGGLGGTITGYTSNSVIRDLGTYDVIKPILDITPAKADGSFHKYVIDLRPFIQAQASAGNTLLGENLKGVWQFFFTYYQNFQYPASTVPSNGFSLKLKNLRIGYYAAPPALSVAGASFEGTGLEFSCGANAKTLSVMAKARDITLALSGADASKFKLNFSSVTASSFKNILVSYTATVAGVYSAILTLTDDEGTLVKTITLTSTNLDPQPIIAASGSTISVTNVTSGYSYQWWNGGSTIAGASMSNYTATGSGVYQASSKGAYCGGSVSNVLSFCGLSKPVATALGLILSTPTVSGVSYSWWSGSTAIAGATSSMYTATTTGSYVVRIMDAICSQTSDAVPVTVSGVSSFSELAGVTLYPNPLPAGQTLKIDGLPVGSLVSISTVEGQLTSSSSAALLPGLYLVTITTPDGRRAVKTLSVQ